ncbi:ORF6N domain-containing protein [Patescibacteria group bacterium]|nr:ORF6N domain-containing protein [Candidatus Falkowbacteria bacterium]MBU3905545.1 ORF6N domain-containing protein [Patescibacteria group bacterium]MBU4015368.1 ORF6N domain-containing protein [Patescibacteria group bacterium]MBU4026322.1 ORF6N domain-containing protein [Patescibacteria group bacterium]MBU4072806.1 ORF6N domain-containing protein [Patescibacteria group bacterium]
MADVILQAKIRNRIIPIRGIRVMLDKDLAEFYGVETKVLNQAVKRNTERFPADFMFQLTLEEFNELVINCDHIGHSESLRSQFVTSKRGGRRYLPYVFTEHGIAMLSSVLKSKRAIQVNIAIVRVFVIVSRIINSSNDLVEKINKLEEKYDTHDKKIKDIFTALDYLIKGEEEKNNKKQEIGFKCK